MEKTHPQTEKSLNTYTLRFLYVLGERLKFQFPVALELRNGRILTSLAAVRGHSVDTSKPRAAQHREQPKGARRTAMAPLGAFQEPCASSRLPKWAEPPGQR